MKPTNANAFVTLNFDKHISLELSIENPYIFASFNEIKNGKLEMKFRIKVEQDADGIFVAECPTLPGCISQGRTRQGALENIQDAIKGYLESLKKHNEPIPPPIESSS